LATPSTIPFFPLNKPIAAVLSRLRRLGAITRRGNKIARLAPPLNLTPP
jgi:hypothetical protein